MNSPIVQCNQLGKSFDEGNHSINVLNLIDFDVQPGAKIAIVGPSGSGKSTLLHLLGGLDKPSAGQVHIKGQDWQVLTERQRCLIRNKELGFIYQFHHLLPEFTALENVAMPLFMTAIPIKEAIARAKHILIQVGLENRVNHKPPQLSGGERQRVAIARALVHKPACVFADEPTGNLDQATATRVFDLMLELNHASKTALVMVTHDKTLASRMDYIFMLQDGQLSLI